MVMIKPGMMRIFPPWSLSAILGDQCNYLNLLLFIWEARADLPGLKKRARDMQIKLID
jgi:hypothetical protein